MASGGLATAMVASGLVGVTIATAPPATAAPCASTVSTPSGGGGSAGDPYLITDLAELTWVRDQVNTGTTFSGEFVELGNSITADCTWTIGIGGGSSFRAFEGTFDGAGFTISGLTVSVPSQDGYAGLFGVVSSGTIRNLTFASATVEHSDTASAAYPAGGIVGTLAAGTLSNVSFQGSVQGSGFTGGLIGRTANSAGTISGSSVVGTVTGSGGYVGGLVGDAAQPLTVTDSYVRGSITGQGSPSPQYVGGLIGRTISSTIAVTDSFSASTVSAGSGATTYVGGVVGFVNGGTFTDAGVTWDTTIGPTQGSDDPVGNTSAEMKDLATYTDAAGLDWNNGGAKTISQGYDATYTWGICSAVNDGYPFLTSFYSSDPCTSGGGGDSTTSAQPTYTFTFRTSDGGRCLADVTVTQFQRFTLPPASVACTPLGTSLAGWAIPGQDWAFRPGREVTVVDNQVFTAVAREPDITVTYDSNVNMNDACVADGTNVELEDDRLETVAVPRTDSADTLATGAPCTPPGFELIGWTDANTPDGSGQAQAGARTYEPGDVVPDQWNLDGPNPVNEVRLYALWGQTSG